MFLFIFLLANTAFGQVLKLPVLIQHYIEHVEQDNSLLLDFLSAHYSDHINHPDGRHHDHENLPFKSDCPVIQAITVVPKSFSFSHLFPKVSAIKKITRNYRDYSSAYLDTIWQPPRIS